MKRIPLEEEEAGIVDELRRRSDLTGDARLPQPGKTAAIMWYGSNGRRRGVAKHGSSGSIPDICRPGAQAREISAMLELATLASLGYKCGAIRAQLFRRNPGATPFRRSSPPRRRYTLEPLSASLVLPISAATIATCHNYFQNFPPSARADSGSPSLCFRRPCTPLPLASAAPSKCCPFPDNLRARARPAPGPPTSTESGRDMLCLSCPVMLGGSDEFGVCRRLVEDLSLPHNMHRLLQCRLL